MQVNLLQEQGRSKMRHRPLQYYNEISVFYLFTITLHSPHVFNANFNSLQVVIVTAATPQRLEEPLHVNEINFCICNLLLTAYALVMAGHGIAWYGVYPLHMWRWDRNAGCGLIGYLLLTSSTASSYFYLLEGFIISLKIRFPLELRYHVTVTRLLLATPFIWALALLVAAVPWMMGNRYNLVASCLPFYHGPYDNGFKFVILYTVLVNVNLLVLVFLAVVMVKSIVRTRKHVTSSRSKQLEDETRQIRNHVTLTLVLAALLNLALLVFLVMSCVGGATGRIGREWFSRLVVLDAAVNPISGPIRKRKFQSDTRKLLAVLGCCRRNEAGSRSNKHKKERDSAKSTARFYAANEEEFSDNNLTNARDEAVDKQRADVTTATGNRDSPEMK